MTVSKALHRENDARSLICERFHDADSVEMTDIWNNSWPHNILISNYKRCLSLGRSSRIRCPTDFHFIGHSQFPAREYFYFHGE